MQFLRENGGHWEKYRDENVSSSGLGTEPQHLIWRDAQPADWLWLHSFWPMGGGWLCGILWRIINSPATKISGVTQRIRWMKGAAEFYDSWLIEDDTGICSRR